jgi:hypothetical protein
MQLSAKLSKAVDTWRKQPAHLRNSLFRYFLDEAVVAHTNARHHLLMGRAKGKEYRHYRNQAAVLRAALDILEAVEPVKKRVSSAKRSAAAVEEKKLRWLNRLERDVRRASAERRESDARRLRGDRERRG